MQCVCDIHEANSERTLWYVVGAGEAGNVLKGLVGGCAVM